MPNLFPLGQVVATPAAIEACRAAGAKLPSLFARHHAGNYGRADQEANAEAVITGDMILSIYQVGTVEVWIKTEGDRSVTTAYLAHED